MLLAQEAAAVCGGGCVEPAHILLGLLWEGDGFAAGVLASLGFGRGFAAPARADASERALGAGLDELELSAEAAEVYRVAEREALNRGLSVVGTEHLLLGLCTVVSDAVLVRLTEDL